MTANDTTARPPVISAAQFVSEDYAAKIAADECEVSYEDNSATIAKVFKDGDAYIAVCVPNPIMVAEGLIDPGTCEGYLDKTGDYKFTVRWLQPAAANAGGQGAAGDLVTRKVVSGEVFGFHNDKDAKTVVLDQMTRGYADAMLEIERLQTALAEAQARADGLREAVYSGEAKVDWTKKHIYREPIKPETTVVLVLDGGWDFTQDETLQVVISRESKK